MCASNPEDNMFLKHESAREGREMSIFVEASIYAFLL